MKPRPAPTRREGKVMSLTGDQSAGRESLAQRVTALEAAVRAFGVELRTQRVVVLDSDGQPRITASVEGPVAELRVESNRELGAPSTAVMLFAARRAPNSDEALGASIGLQLWAEGEQRAELSAAPSLGGRWQPVLYLQGD